MQLFIDLFDRLRQESPVITAAPLSFTLAVLCSALIIGLILFYSLRSYYRALLAIKDEAIHTYQEHLGLLPPSPSPFARASNLQLQQRTLLTIQLIRQFLQQMQKEGAQQAAISHLTSVHTIGETQEQKLQKQTLEQLLNDQYLEESFRQKFKVDTILLRDELRSRLSPDNWGGRDAAPNFYYDHPLGRPTIEAVADDLERLAKKLTV